MSEKRLVLCTFVTGGGGYMVFPVGNAKEAWENGITEEEALEIDHPNPLTRDAAIKRIWAPFTEPSDA